MDGQKETSLTDLLNVDLEAIANEGKRISKRRSRILIVASIVTLALAFVIGTFVYCQNRNEQKYQEAMAALQNEEYETAIAFFQELGNYKDSQGQIDSISQQIKYKEAIAALQNKEYETATILFQELGNYKDSQKQLGNISQQMYSAAMSYFNDGDYTAAITLFQELGNYKDSQEFLNKAETILEDSKEFGEKFYPLAIEHEKAMHYTLAKKLFGMMLYYRDAREHYDNMMEIFKPYNKIYSVKTSDGRQYKMIIEDGEGTLQWDDEDSKYFIDFFGYGSDELAFRAIDTPIEITSQPYSNSDDAYQIVLYNFGQVKITACEGNEFSTYEGSGYRQALE